MWNASEGVRHVNPTIEKFGYSATLIRKFDHWLVLLRPAQVVVATGEEPARPWR